MENLPFWIWVVLLNAIILLAGAGLSILIVSIIFDLCLFISGLVYVTISLPFKWQNKETFSSVVKNTFSDGMTVRSFIKDKDKLKTILVTLFLGVAIFFFFSWFLGDILNISSVKNATLFSNDLYRKLQNFDFEFAWGFIGIAISFFCIISIGVLISDYFSFRKIQNNNHKDI